MYKYIFSMFQFTNMLEQTHVFSDYIYYRWLRIHEQFIIQFIIN